MNPFEQLRADLLQAIEAAQRAGELPAALPLERITVEPPRDPAHGDAATNAALILAKPAGRPPMAVAEALAARLRTVDKIAAVELAGPGFVNLRLSDGFWRAQVKLALEAGSDYGAADLGRGRRVNVEYCSANPTGRLHVGHGRGTAFGDALANLLARMGFAVTREYYINDSGAQVDVLARSVHHRYLEALGAAPAAPPSDWYPSEEVRAVGAAILAEDGDRWLHATEADWLPVFRSRSVAAILALIKEDLAALGVHHDVFTSEAALAAAGRIEQTLAELERQGLVYEGTLAPPKGRPSADWRPRPQLLFRATAFGDDVDRPLQRAGGQWTYLAADLAYHLDKIQRGAEELIDVWGADHGGYIKRVQAGVRALSAERVTLDVKICQLVNLMDRGQPLRMSKRAGRIVNLRDVIDEVGKDVVRFIMLTRKNDAPLEFDLTKVTEQSRDNPVWYVQYAHARICSVRRHAQAAGIEVARGALAAASLADLVEPEELALIRQMATFPRTLEAAAIHHEPHRIAFYLGDLAASFHALWNQGKERPELRFLRPDQPAVSQARLAMITAVQIVLASGLELIGVTPVEEMV
ncbi:MAG: arginine--tRNA ligase [Geminicoccaceae bacterium]